MNKRIFKDETSTIGEIPFYKIGTFGGKADAFITRKKYEEYKKKYPYPQKGNLLISASGSIGRIIEYNGEEAYYQDSNIVWLDHDNTILDVFLKPTYEIIKWDGIEGTTIKRLYNKNILNTVIYKPTIDEQRKLGKLFIILNNTIQLHERKYEELTLIKKALLQKLFPKKDGFKPEVRYKNFNDAWEQRKLGEVVERRIEKRRQSERYPRLAFASGQGVIPLSERKTNNREQLTKDEFTKKYLVTELDDIVYNPANVKYGAIDRNKYGRGLISPIYVTFTTEEVPGFIERIVKSHDFKQKALRFEEGTVTKRQSVNPEDLVTINILVASQKKEQKKISLFFDNIDTFIALHRRKLEKLKQLKKFLLQNMFI
ncbi:restriction endonuclease subunit S [Ligilactobacillus salivarius]|uniref:restriction endonuclease subunit S n=1 Tax=Ligilactobacillus salivarius TaxID=1624 RepID=UPI001E4F40E4|nr:restriction endonuclease subunit S [Ligilactobacillus salivarius]UHL92830.1 restriction endonuclease subunit S [Ligilactobacillus salivarius]